MVCYPWESDRIQGTFYSLSCDFYCLSNQIFAFMLPLERQVEDCHIGGRGKVKVNLPWEKILHCVNHPPCVLDQKHTCPVQLASFVFFQQASAMGTQKCIILTVLELLLCCYTSGYCVWILVSKSGQSLVTFLDSTNACNKLALIEDLLYKEKLFSGSLAYGQKGNLLSTL